MLRGKRPVTSWVAWLCHLGLLKGSLAWRLSCVSSFLGGWHPTAGALVAGRALRDLGAAFHDVCDKLNCAPSQLLP